MGNEQSGGAEHWAATPEAAVRRRERMVVRSNAGGSGKAGTGGEAKSSESNKGAGTPALNPIMMTARTAQALKGRKLFSDFQDAQADYARKWGEEKGIDGITELFEKEAPLLAQKYAIVQAMACGVTAVVCKGIERDTGQAVAVKFVRIRVQGLSDAMRRQDCREEARLQKLCDHRNVVKLLDFEMGNHFALYVLEFIPSTLLQKIVERNSNVQYSERSAAGYIRDIAMALHQCHSQRVVHMDVKLDNILCDDDNVAKLCDFGVAEQMQYADAPIQRNVAAPLFAPPEVHTLGLCTTQADMWSLGICLYIMLCGYPPFKESELQRRIVKARYVFPEREWKSVSIMARDLISRLLVIDTKRRLTAQQVLEHPWVKAVGKAAPVERSIAIAHVPPPTFISVSSPPASAEGANTEQATMACSAPPVVPFCVENKNEQVEEKTTIRRTDTESVSSSISSTSSSSSPTPGGSVPLPLRVTKFLRNMHHYRELEKKGFENVPGGLLYRNILDGVDEITVGIGKNAKAGAETPPVNQEKIQSIETGMVATGQTSLMQRIHMTLQIGRSSSSRIQVEPERSRATSDDSLKFFPKLVNYFEDYYFPDENDCDPTSDQQKPPSEEKQLLASAPGGSSPTVLSGKDIYAFSKIRRQGSLCERPAESEDTESSIGSASSSISNSEADSSSGGGASTVVLQCQLSSSEDSQARATVPSGPKWDEKTTCPEPAPDRRLIRVKSFDIGPEAAPAWIDDEEAISCRLCDREFTVFIRKHHCRSCGNCFCDSCSQARVRLGVVNKSSEPQRVCKLCATYFKRVSERNVKQ